MHDLSEGGVGFGDLVAGVGAFDVGGGPGTYPVVGRIGGVSEGRGEGGGEKDAEECFHGGNNDRR